MKKSFYLFLALAFAALGCSCNRYETVAGDALQTKVYTLDNGLKVFMSVNKEAPRIQTYIAVRVGGKNDPSETTGLAHYFEHLMFKGSEHFGTADYQAEKPMLDEIEALFETYRHTTDEAARAALYHRIDSVSYEASKLAIPNEYDKLMAMIGAEGTNAWTSSDETVYTEDIPSNQIDNWARIQADRFRYGVIRGFHTELETIYEEKNMSLTKDSRKVWEALDAALFPNHPYGKQTVLGTQEHLKNPSITNVKKYHDTYYVPNNIAICVSGDFKPSEMVAAIEKYFGTWQPNPDIPALQYEPEQPILTPVVRNVYGLEAENLAIAWRLPGAADLKNTATADIAAAILYNGQAGLIDIDVVQGQKALYAAAFNSVQPDYSSFIAMGGPKQGQSLEQVRDIILEEVARLRDGNFDENLISATINNVKLAKMKELESNSSRAVNYVNAFINGISWEDACREVERLEAVTKDDVVAWAGEFLKDSSYAVVYKRQGVDNSVQKISAPKITPIVTNRDMQSDFLKEIQGVQVKPIDPVFVDFSKDMSRFTLGSGVEVLYKHNDLNDIFTLEIAFNTGRCEDPALNAAFDYVTYLGTPAMSAEQIASRMYELACDFSFSVRQHRTVITLSGLSENMSEALSIVADLVGNAVPDDAILEGVKSDIIKDRADSKKKQSSCFGALRTYMYFGPEEIRRTSLDNDALLALSSEELLSKVRSLVSQGHEVLYYGPASEEGVKEGLAACALVAEGGAPRSERHQHLQPTVAPKVVMVQYDAKQIYYNQFSCRGEDYDPAAQASIDLYNEYFGGGMNTIVFQEMREARGLAYSAWATLGSPSYADDSYYYMAFIATQNDKMRQAVEAFDDIINDMPESEAAFKVAREGLISRMRTQRTNGIGVLRSYVDCRRLGLDEPLDRQIYEKVQGMTLEDVKAVQQEWVKDRCYTYGILGDIKDLDTDFLRTLGPVQKVSLEEIFGY